MFDRGPIDHMGLHAGRTTPLTDPPPPHRTGCPDGFVTDFGPALSLFFIDPDGLEGEVCVTNPNAPSPGWGNPPWHPVGAICHQVVATGCR